MTLIAPLDKNDSQPDVKEKLETGEPLKLPGQKPISA